MIKQRYVVVPGILFVAGAPVPTDRKVMLTPEEARYDLGLARIYLDGTQPPVSPVQPVLGADILLLTRGGVTQPATMEELAAFIGAAGRPVLALSAIVFPVGTTVGTPLAAITAPLGWVVTAETTFGGRVAVGPDGRMLVCSQAISAAAIGTARLRATSPDGLRWVVETFALTFEPSSVPQPAIPTGVVTGLLHSLPLALAA